MIPVNNMEQGNDKLQKAVKSLEENKGDQDI